MFPLENYDKENSFVSNLQFSLICNFSFLKKCLVRICIFFFLKRSQLGAKCQNILYKIVSQTKQPVAICKMYFSKFSIRILPKDFIFPERQNFNICIKLLSIE